VLLKRKGFSLGYDPKTEEWTCEINKFYFRADNPIELLGLASIYLELKPTEKKEYWWQINEPNLLTELDPEN
jgi:hypothetical protein